MNNAFIAFLQLCVCVCIACNNPRWQQCCLICWWISQSAAQTTSQGRKREREGRVQSSGPRENESSPGQARPGSRQFAALPLPHPVATSSCSCSCNVFCIIKGSHKLPWHAQLKILIDDWMQQQQQLQQQPRLMSNSCLMIEAKGKRKKKHNFKLFFSPSPSFRWFRFVQQNCLPISC